MSKLYGPAELMPPVFRWGVAAKLPYAVGSQFSVVGGELCQGQFADGRPVIFGITNRSMSEGFGTQTTDTFVFSADGLTFAPGGAFPGNQVYLRSARLGDGRILAVGSDWSGATLYAQTMDPGSLAWTVQPAPTTAYSFPVMVTLASGNVLRIAGALINTSPSPVPVEEYDQGSNAWTPRAPTINAHENPVAALLPNGEVLITSWYQPPEVYVPGTNSWHPTTNLPQSLNKCQTMVLLPNGKLFTCASLGGTMNADLYDPIDRTFSPLASVATVHNQGIQTFFNNGFYMGEGLVAVANPSYAPRVSFYDYRKDKWYDGGFDNQIPESGFNEPLGYSNLFYLGEYGFLILGDPSDYIFLPHRQGVYTQISNKPLNDGGIPTFTGGPTVVRGNLEDRVLVEWLPATDTKTDSSDIIYYIYQGIGGPPDFSVSVANTEIWAGSLSKEIIGLLPGTPYEFGVRARNMLTKGAPGNFEYNVGSTGPGFVTGPPDPPTFAWVDTAPMSQPRSGLMGMRRADGRFLVCGGWLSTWGFGQVGVGDVYSQTGLTCLPSVFGPSAAAAAALDESPEGSSEKHRPTVVGGTNGYVTWSEVVKNYPYSDYWHNYNFQNDNAQRMNTVGADLTAVALPGGDILRMGGVTAWNDPSTVTNVVERMSYLPTKIDYRDQTIAFTVGNTVTGTYSGAQGVILADTGPTRTFLGLSSTSSFVIGETVTGQNSGASGVIDDIGGYDGCLYLSGVTGAFDPYEPLIGDIAGTGNNTGLIETSIGTLTIKPIGTAAFISVIYGTNWHYYNEPITDGAGDGFAVNVPPWTGTAGSERYHTNQNWSIVAPMNVARYAHSAIRLTTGNVLVVGGLDAAGSPIQSAEVYEPDLDVWTLLPSGLVYRYYSGWSGFTPGETVTGQTSLVTATVVQYVSTGGSTGAVFLTGESGAFAAGEQILGDMGADAYLETGIAEDYIGVHVRAPLVIPAGSTYVWAIGGASARVDIFNPMNYFTRAADLDSIKEGHTALAIGDPGGSNLVVIFGGNKNGGAACAEVRSHTVTPVTGAWTAENDMLYDRTRHVSFLLPNNKVLVAGGDDASGDAQASAELSS